MQRLLLTLMLVVPALHASELAADRQLTDSLRAISEARMPEARNALELLTEQHPNFRLAQLIKGDMLLARVQALQTLGNPDGASSTDLELLRDEARQRMRAVTDAHPHNKVPAYLLNLDNDYRHALVVDASRSRLYVYENRAGQPLRVADFYVTIGKAGAGKQKEGDKRTPIGIYAISSYKPSSELGDFYGSGAFTLSYPNEWDTRQGRSGHGIWIHGSPSNTYSRAPRASEGCVVLANDDLTRLGEYIETGKTPVIIAEQVEWIEQEMLIARRDDLTAAIDQWRQDWESRDTSRLLSHYSTSFHTGKQNLTAFAANKHKVNADRSWIKVSLDNLSLMLYPQGTAPGSREALATDSALAKIPTSKLDAEQTGFALVSFVQRYQSNTLNDRTTKRQFWSRENGHWKIIHETSL